MPSFKIETPSLSHLSHEDYINVYEPAEDSFLLLDALEDDLELLQQRRPVLCLEVGSGSGVVTTAIARTLGAEVFCLAIDINQAACSATNCTAKENGVKVDVINGDLVTPLRGVCAVDLLVFNPPYVPTPHCEVITSLEEPLTRAWAGGERGREVMDRLFPLLPEVLAPQGLFYMVAIENNDVPQIREVLSALGFQSHVVKQRRVRGEHLVVLRCQKHSDSLE
ncbi:hypothetical protein R5R35_007903 [Gryllus longicercus]|uniref:Methyltransferase HEMK2 n=1 Tax=Gryllus longicercus TaxID=2509291 RepID=A0AAN9V750_9ORTH